MKRKILAILLTMVFSLSIVFLMAVPVQAQNDSLPIANDDSSTTDEDTLVNIDVLYNDSGDNLTITMVSDPANGTVVIVSDNNTVTYTPDANYFGTDNFTYQIIDEHSNTDNATVTITINPVNDAPVAYNVSVSTDEDTDKVITLSGSDVETVELTFTIVAQPSHGTLGTTANATGTIGTPNTDTATVTYTPALNYNGTDNFTYQVNDGALNSDNATVTITINPVNDAPVAVITPIDDQTIDLPVTIKVTPQTLNLDRSGKWVKVHVFDDSENTPQEIGITLDGSGSHDPDGDPLTYDWTLTRSGGDIPVTDNVSKQVVYLSDGEYEVTLVVNDGVIDSYPATDNFTLTDMTIDDLLSEDPEDFILNGISGSEVKGGGSSIVISFDHDAVAETVEAGLDVEMVLEGPVSGVDYIDVISEKGKSELKGDEGAGDQNSGPGEEDNNGQGNGKDSAPGQNKESEKNAEGKAKGKGSAPGQDK